MDYYRYGVNENPYQPKAIGIGDTSRFDPVHPMDGSTLESSLSSAIAEGGGARYVITGTSGSGRTAVASYIVSLYDSLWSRTSQRSGRVAHYARQHDGNVNGRQVARDVLKGLAGEVKRLDANLLEGPFKRLRDEVRELPADYSVQDLQSIAQDFSIEVHSLSASFTCVVENVPNLEVFRAVQDLLTKSKGLLVCTLVAEQREAILGMLKNQDIGEEIMLANLADDGTWLLTKGRWNRSSAAPPIPFDPDGLKNAFHDNPRTVGKLLETLAFMINSKLANYSGQGIHPTDAALRFDERQIRELIKLYDQVIK